MTSSSTIKVKCRHCNRDWPSNDFVLDPVYKMMVCAPCSKERKAKEAANPKAAKPGVKNEPLRQGFSNSSPEPRQGIRNEPTFSSAPALAHPKSSAEMRAQIQAEHAPAAPRQPMGLRNTPGGSRHASAEEDDPDDEPIVKHAATPVRTVQSSGGNAASSALMGMMGRSANPPARTSPQQAPKSAPPAGGASAAAAALMGMMGKSTSPTKSQPAPMSASAPRITGGGIRNAPKPRQEVEGEAEEAAPRRAEKPAGWDADDAELERLERQKSESAAVMLDKDKYQCPNCKYIFTKNAAVSRIYARCPFCHADLGTNWGKALK